MGIIIKDLGLLINAMLIATPPLLLAALGSCFSERETAGSAFSAEGLRELPLAYFTRWPVSASGQTRRFPAQR